MNSADVGTESRDPPKGISVDVCRMCVVLILGIEIATTSGLV